MHRCLRLHITFKFTGLRCVNLPQIDIPSGLQRLGLPIANSSHQPPASTEELSVKVTKPNPRDLVTSSSRLCTPGVESNGQRVLCMGACMEARNYACRKRASGTITRTLTCSLSLSHTQHRPQEIAPLILYLYVATQKPKPTCKNTLSHYMHTVTSSSV